MEGKTPSFGSFDEHRNFIQPRMTSAGPMPLDHNQKVEYTKAMMLIQIAQDINDMKHIFEQWEVRR